MSKSEIFDRFVKIAQEKGMISEDAPEKAKKILEKTQRADSLDISAIEALYGVKPKAPKDMEYKRNIIEDAHPNSVIVSPSYDKLNGLFENDNERQDILLNIVNKNNDGHSTHHKYAARKDLVLSLVRVANDLDNKDETKLRILADTCLEQMALKKHAWIPIAVGIAAAVGALYVQQHMSFTNEGFQKNHEKLVAEIDDMLNSNSDWGVGSSYTSEFHSMLVEFKNKLIAFDNMYQKVFPLISNLEKPRTAKELMEISQKPETDSVVKAHGVLRESVKQMSPYLDAIKRNFASEGYKARQTQDKGILTSLVDKMQIFHGGKGLVADDFDDVVHAIDPYQKSISEMLEILKRAESIEKSARTQLDQSMAQNQKEFGGEMAEKPGEPGKVKSDDFGIADLEKDLAGGLV